MSDRDLSTGNTAEDQHAKTKPNGSGHLENRSHFWHFLVSLPNYLGDYSITLGEAQYRARPSRRIPVRSSWWSQRTISFPTPTSSPPPCAPPCRRDPDLRCQADLSRLELRLYPRTAERRRQPGAQGRGLRRKARRDDGGALRPPTAIFGTAVFRAVVTVRKLSITAPFLPVHGRALRATPLAEFSFMV
jgi:hypothetical protein